MIITVTTSSMSTTAMMSSMAVFGLSLELVAVVCLIGYLCVKELAGASHGSSPRLLMRSLDVALVPLIVAFVVTLAIRVTELLR